MPKSIQSLREEHEVILRALDILNIIGNSKGIGREVIDDIKKIVEFIKNFVDNCHHEKEEKVLFNFLERKGFVEGPIQVMLYEHNELRQMINQIESKYNEPEGLKESLDSLILLLTSHIDKENSVLFPMAENMITDEEDKELYERFEGIEKEFGINRHKEYVNLVNNLYTKYSNLHSIGM
ncbi:MAG: hemerythrin domain-containing protein [Sulfolobaceae archaeon]